MGPLAQKLRNTKVDIAVSLLRFAHDSTRGISVGISDFQTTLPVYAQALTPAKHSAQQKLVELTSHQWKRKSRSCIFCVPATEANLLEVIEKWRGPRVSFAKIQNALEMISMRRDL